MELNVLHIVLIIRELILQLYDFVSTLFSALRVWVIVRACDCIRILIHVWL